MNIEKLTNKKRNRRAKRTRRSINKNNFPRLSVLRTNKYIFAQIIDDSQKKTIVSFHSKNITDKKNKTDIAKEVGLKIAGLAKENKINQVVFDRGRYRFHGRIKALAEGAKEGGLKF